MQTSKFKVQSKFKVGCADPKHMRVSYPVVLSTYFALCTFYFALVAVASAAELPPLIDAVKSGDTKTTVPVWQRARNGRPQKQQRQAPVKSDSPFASLATLIPVD